MVLTDIESMGEQYLSEFVYPDPKISIIDSVLIGVHIRAFVKKTAELQKGPDS